MIFIYNLIISLILYGTQEISRYYHFEFNKWSYIDWYFFIAFLIFLFGLFAYLTPFFVDCLDEIMNRITVWIMVKYSDNINKLEKKLIELKKDD